MHTKLSKDNPFKYSYYGFAWEHTPANTQMHLDFGCYNGEFLNTLKNKNIKRLVGVDISTKAVEQAYQLFPDLDVIRINNSRNLPFDDNAFDSITILDVLEHIYEQNEVLAELYRVLKPKSKIIVTVPGQHLFSFLDMGNLKFRFPKLHKWYYCRSHSPEQYQHRYVSNTDGLIGDISVKKRWHEHFKREKLVKMLEQAGFEIIDIDGAGFFSRIIRNISYFLRRIKPIYKILSSLSAFDSKTFESVNLFCLAQKKSD